MLRISYLHRENGFINLCAALDNIFCGLPIRLIPLNMTLTLYLSVWINLHRNESKQLNNTEIFYGLKAHKYIFTNKKIHFCVILFNKSEVYYILFTFWIFAIVNNAHKESYCPRCAVTCTLLYTKCVNDKLSVRDN